MQHARELAFHLAALVRGLVLTHGPGLGGLYLAQRASQPEALLQLHRGRAETWLVLRGIGEGVSSEQRLAGSSQRPAVAGIGAGPTGKASSHRPPKPDFPLLPHS